MSRDQKFVITALVLGNLILYGLAFLSVPVAPAQAPLSSQPTLQVAEAAATPTAESTSTPVATDTPVETSTPEQTATPATPTETPTPSVTPTSSTTPTITPTPRPTMPAGVALRVTPVPTKVVLTATPIPTKAPAGGTDPTNALLPAGDWRTIGANSSLWYKIGTGGNHIVATLQAQPLDGMRLEVFAPNIWDRPIGAGSHSNGVDGLVWAGGRWENYGDWFARVVNANSGPVTYRLVVNSNEIPACEVIGYWEYIGSNYVYWKRCK